MEIDLNVLNHLGLSLYSNTPSVLSEIVANSYDADATEVRIYTDDDTDKITIVDNGNGMDVNDINNKFLRVGYQKRKSGESKSPKFSRDVMGRKGIGKLSLFSIAETIEIHTIKDNNENAFRMNLQDIQRSIEITSNDEKQLLTGEKGYSPEIISVNKDYLRKNGTKIIISNLKKNISRTEEYLKRRLSRRFSLMNPKGGFTIFINDVEVGINDRGYIEKIDIAWPIGDYKMPGIFKGNLQPNLDGKIVNNDVIVSGWIGSVNKPSDLVTDTDDTNNKISIICRGKLAQEDILKFFNEGGIYASYLIGEIHADFLDEDDKIDIATSSRQNFIEDDERFQSLRAHVYQLLKIIQGQWTNLRSENATAQATQNNQALNSWYSSLKADEKKQAKKLFTTVESLHFDNNEDEKRKELYKYGILSFEKLRARNKLSELEDISLQDLLKFKEIFSDLQDIEAAMYYDIASERVEIIRKLKESTDTNAREKVLQEHLFDNLWLLNSSWERATAGSELMEQNIHRAFESITDKLTEEEKKARFDIKYRTSSDKHVIIELKRYKAGYSIDTFSLGAQINKYITALKKCLESTGKHNPHIEAICVVGPDALDDIEETNKHLKVQNGIAVTYDSLIENAFTSYSTYLENNRKVGKLRELIDKL
ncbi:ATP-binding protein [Sphingobacterium sp. G1-14]|uniref:BbrUII/HgiDII family restriction enzyme n=1 Tax=Sphingobacterium sp. G1-14 TaxID=2003121 RepID=UPI0012FE4881|nr:ATP-binding protein [Sphingobacterium sp. G1-14]